MLIEWQLRTPTDDVLTYRAPVSPRVEWLADLIGLPAAACLVEHCGGVDLLADTIRRTKASRVVRLVGEANALKLRAALKSPVYVVPLDRAFVSRYLASQGLTLHEIADQLDLGLGEVKGFLQQGIVIP